MPPTSPARRSFYYVGYAGTAGLLLLAAFAVQAATAAPTAQTHSDPMQNGKKTTSALPRLRYNRDIRPILAENCFACHGPDSAARKAGLRLDKFAEATATQNGVTPILPGKPLQSEIIRRIMGQGPLMPPPEGHKSLNAAQIGLLKRWIAEGAQYEQHWAYTAPVRPALPTVKNTAWSRNPIDRFILARMESAGIAPAPEADRRILARRLSLDLTGLPPDPADVTVFLNDKSSSAYEKLVDRFLASPHWGEHRGRYWLDAARYADTNGIHFDNYREMWAYRDWVIHAFNKNMPFDQFTIEQLAGDLLPAPTLDQRIATGFNRCNITTNEGGAIDEEYRVLYARDRTETTSQVWLGSTLGCTVCHDHKFDPFTQKDFYSMSALFNNTTQPVMDGNIASTPPVLPVPRDEDRPRFAALQTELADARAQTAARKVAALADFERWLGQANASSLAAAIPARNLVFQAALNEGQGRSVQAVWADKPLPLTANADPGWETGQTAAKAFVLKPGSALAAPQVGDFERSQAFSTSAWIKLPNAGLTGAIMARMDDQHDFRGWDLWIQNARPATHIISKWPSDALKVVSKGAMTLGVWHHVCITYSGGATPDAVNIYIDGKAQDKDVEVNALKGPIHTTVPFKIGRRDNGQGMDGTAIQDVRLYSRVLSPDEAASLARGTRAAWLIARGVGQLSPAEKTELFGGWLTGTDDAFHALTGKVALLEGEENAIRMRGTQAHVMQERSEEAQAYILARGDYDKRKDPVKPATPAVFPALPADYPKNRLGFARWLVRPEHPLTARVTVNRFWQEIFGQALVRTPGDFGVMGELPSHPELLDWLAVDFRESGWDIKRFYKQIVMSATYRQSAVITPLKQQKDPKNILLSRAPRFRMDAEMVRDYALTASGLLVPKIGGPSVRPYQPDGVWEAVAITGSNTRDYKRDMGENLYRRSLYTFWKRSAPPASLDIFNAPSRETCTVRRERTDTPLQALVTLNDPQFVEAARMLAQKALQEGHANERVSIDVLAERLLSRPFRPEEQAVVARSLTDLKAFYAANPKDAQALLGVGEAKADPARNPQELAAWTMLANQLMNLDEVLNK